jgi:hypothetical protein
MGFIRALGCTENSLIDDAATIVEAETATRDGGVVTFVHGEQETRM